jgi:ribose-phosphate pyrophosphokinase
VDTRWANVEVLAGPAHPRLAAALARELRVTPLPHLLTQSDDGERLVRVDELARGRSVIIVQPIASPVGDSLLELLLLADACWRVGAARVAAAVPYLGYLRQDRRTRAGEALGCRVVADVLGTGRFDPLFIVDPHAPGVEAAFRCPVEMLTAAPLLMDPIREQVGIREQTGVESVIVAPDLGATKLARRYARSLRLPMAIVYKERLGPSEVRAQHIIGDVAGRRPVIVDDMISTGGTVAAASELLLAQGARPEIVVLATHGLFAGPAIERLRSLPLVKVVVTDSVAQPASLPFPCEVVSVAPLLAEAVSGTRARESIVELE